MDENGNAGHDFGRVMTQHGKYTASDDNRPFAQLFCLGLRSGIILSGFEVGHYFVWVRGRALSPSFIFILFGNCSDSKKKLS